jgi:predicted RNase H-like HicB family nuclease
LTAVAPSFDWLLSLLTEKTPCYNRSWRKQLAVQKAYIPVRFKLCKDGVDYEFQTAEEGGYVVSVPLYPSCVSEGDTFEEALSNAEDALHGCLLTARELNLPIPKQLQSIAGDHA